MSSELVKHWFEDVVPAVEDYRGDVGNLRLARYAALELNHMVDYLFEFDRGVVADRNSGASSVRELRSELIKRSRSLGIIADVADAYKHAELNRKKRQLTSHQQTVRLAVGYGEAQFGVDEFGGTSRVFVYLDTGEQFQFAHLMEEAVRMWEAILSELDK